MSAIENLTMPEPDDSWMEEYVTDESESWPVTNGIDAAEAMRRARYFQSQIDELTAIKLAQIDQVDRWYAKQIAKVSPNLNKYQIPLQRFADSKEESLTYPAGVLLRRAKPESVEVLDDAALIAVAIENEKLKDVLTRLPEPVEPQRVVAKDEIKKALKDGRLQRNKNGELVDPESGEVIPGAKITRKDPSFDFEFSEVQA